MKFFLIFVFVMVFFIFAETARAEVVSAPLEISGWIPYWRKATGTQEAILRLDVFKEINPFGYTVKTDGALFDAMDIQNEPWPSLIAAARAKKIRVIPTVMWANAAAIDKTMRSAKLRNAHIKAIVKIVNENNFDGIDIDYEGKYAKTKNYFSYFLRDLQKALGKKKWLMCTIESRTPLSSRYDTIPKNITYANDFVAINKYCDRVRIMTYDQGSIDLRLNETEAGPYAPVADKRWVEKVIKLVLKTISKNKLSIGVATYGYEYEAVRLAEDGFKYDLLWNFNPKYALDLAQQLNITPERNSAGELNFAYSTISSSTPTMATSTPFNILWWSDASAIKDKITLAKKLGVRGISIFKIDGGADPLLWDILK